MSDKNEPIEEEPVDATVQNESADATDEAFTAEATIESVVEPETRDEEMERLREAAVLVIASALVFEQRPVGLEPRCDFLVDEVEQAVTYRADVFGNRCCYSCHSGKAPEPCL